MSLLLFIVVIGGLYLGVFSPTEAGGIGACGAFIFAIARRRLSWQGFKESLFDTMKNLSHDLYHHIGRNDFQLLFSNNQTPI